MQVITNVVLFIVAWICLATLVAAGFARFFIIGCVIHGIATAETSR